MAKINMKSLIVSVVLIIIGVALVPVLTNFIVAANVTDPTLALALSLLPLVLVFVLVLAMVDIL